MAQAVCRGPFLIDSRVQFQASSYGIYGAPPGTGRGFLRLLRFSIVSIISPSIHTILLASITDAVRSEQYTASLVNTLEKQRLKLIAFYP